MAERELKFILSATNKTDKAFADVQHGIDGIKGKVESMGPAFKKMAAIGTAAFVGIGGAVALSVKEAAIAEGSFNKFNTVFGKHSEDMLEFVDQVRKEMPSARHEIVRMAADMQDLLVPLGLSREKATEMSKGFIDVANKIAAFNDVAPTQVLEDIKSALAGSSEPLRKYGINALETSLEATAMKMGLLGTKTVIGDVSKEQGKYNEKLEKTRNQLEVANLKLQEATESGKAKISTMTSLTNYLLF